MAASSEGRRTRRKKCCAACFSKARPISRLPLLSNNIARRTGESERLISVIGLSSPSTRNSKSSTFSVVSAVPLLSTTEAGMGTRLEETRTMSDSSTSSPVVFGEVGDAVEGVWELRGRLASAIGLGAERAFVFESLRRPDCAVTLASRTNTSMTRETVARKTHEALRRENFTTPSPAWLRVPAEDLLTKHPILLVLTPPGTDDGHVSYEGGGDLVLLTAATEQK